MTGLLRRFAAVGLLVTGVDVAALLLLAAAAGLPLLAADAVALTLAAAASWALHRRVTFPDEPLARGLHQSGPFLRVALAAAVLDAVVLAAVAGDVRDAGTLARAKVAAVGVAAAVRFVSWRRLLLPALRGEQEQRVARDPAPGDVRLSVVVPAYREAGRIGGTVAALREALAPVGTYEIVVVDDGSPDATAAEARAAGADEVVRLDANFGKGAAVRAGVLAARGRTIAFTDADLSYAPAQLARLLAEVEAGWDMVVGSRRHVDTTTLVRARRLREVSGRLFNLLTLLVLLGRYRDTQCGLKAFRSDVAHLLFSRGRIDGFAFDVELFHLAERYRLSLRELPVELANASSSTVRLGAHALEMVRDLVRIRALASTGAYDGGSSPVPRGAVPGSH